MVLSSLVSSVGAAAADSDADGIDDLLDNCVNLPNGPLLANPAGGASQMDSDGDGYGNRCDGDLNNNGFTNAQDALILMSRLGRSGDDAADISGNGFVNTQDVLLFRQLIGQPPGPGSEPPCSNGGDWPTACAFHGDNAYDWDVFASHPDCTSTASSILHIDGVADWNHVNNSAFDVFCVHPGDYRNWRASKKTVLKLTRDGTQATPRWIVLFDPARPNDRTHPALLVESARAIMPHFQIDGGDHWRIVRMTVKGYGCETSGVCSGNVMGTNGTRFSHMLIEEGEKSAFPYVVRDSNGISNGDYIFQYIVHRNVVPAYQKDRIAFYIEGCASQPCTIVRNEIINPASDAITVASSNYTGGLRIDENEMYLTDDVRSNCGGLAPDGACAPNEMMIAFKAPTALPASTSYITNNVIHHTYVYDFTLCCFPGNGSYPAPAINIGTGGVPGPLSNVVIENNVIYETAAGIQFRNDGTSEPGTGAANAVVKRNLLSGVSSFMGSDAALATYLGYGHIETNNVIVDTAAYVGTTSYLGFYKTHACNVVLDGHAVNPSFPIINSTWENNFAYGDTEIRPASDTGYTASGARADARHDQLCVVSSFITNPTRYCVADGKVTAQSPHFSCRR